MVVEEETNNPIPSLNTRAGPSIEAFQKSKGMNETRKWQVEELLESYQNVFSDVPGGTKLLQCRLELATSKPLNTPQYPLPFPLQDVV